MLSRTLFFACLLLLGSCAVGERPTLTGESIDDGTLDGASNALDGGVLAGPAAAADTEVGGPLPDVDALGESPPVLISPSGVVVPVLSRSAEGFIVRTPCGHEADLVWGHPIFDAVVVLDPGHGGDERGAIGPSGEAEAEVNLDIARRTATVLEGQGIAVALTRTGDYRIPISNRAAIADQLQAFVFVSIHHNSPTPNPADWPGVEIYVQNDSDDSSRLGGLLHEELISALSVFDVEWASRSDAGVLTVINPNGEDAFGVNRYPTTPSALAELAYISNPTEALVIGTSEYRQSSATALATGIVRYLNTSDPGSGFISEPRLFEPSGATGGTDGCIDPPLE